MIKSDRLVVLTTPERADSFRAAVGHGADMVFDFERTDPLEPFLTNISMSGCDIVVLDEAHFVTSDVMKRGLRAYVDDPRNAMRGMRIIVVCSDREPGDSFLSFIVGYLDIYDTLVGLSGTKLASALTRVMKYPMTRMDVLELLKPSVLSGETAPDCREQEDPGTLDLNFHFQIRLESPQQKIDKVRLIGKCVEIVKN